MATTNLLKKLIVFFWALLFACTGNHEKVVERWENNQTKAKKVYYNDRDTSQFLMMTYYSDGGQRERTRYQDGIKNGWSITFHTNGLVKDSIFYRDNVPVTTYRNFYFNGKLAVSGTNDDFGKRIGWWTFYDSLGVITKLTEFTNGIEQTKTYYFDNRGWMVKECVRFQEGPIGSVLEERNYRDSVLHGGYVKYFDNGNIEKRGEYLNGGRKNTIWTGYYRSGKKCKDYLFTGDDENSLKILSVWDKDGHQTVTNGNGKHVIYSYCPNGKAETKTVTYYKNGEKINDEIFYVNTCR